MTFSGALRNQKVTTGRSKSGLISESTVEDMIKLLDELAPKQARTCVFALGKKASMTEDHILKPLDFECFYYIMKFEWKRLIDN